MTEQQDRVAAVGKGIEGFKSTRHDSGQLVTVAVWKEGVFATPVVEGIPAEYIVALESRLTAAEEKLGVAKAALRKMVAASDRYGRCVAEFEKDALSACGEYLDLLFQAEDKARDALTQLEEQSKP